MPRNSQQNQEPSHQRWRANADATGTSEGTGRSPKQDGGQSHVWALHFSNIAMTTSQLRGHTTLTRRTSRRACADAWRGLGVRGGSAGSRPQQDLDLPRPLIC